MNRIVLSSPAKLNLFLKVQNKRPDGFHNIVTIFERIDLADRIEFCSTKNNNIDIKCNHPDVPLGPKNLVYKVARLLKDDFGIKQGVKIKIDKRIPVAAGLAGGSSNAATALLGLNRLWNLKLGKAQLVSYAKKIGSDVAFFLHDSSYAMGTERGDNIKKIDINRKYWHILIVPRIKMYSWRVYGGLKMPVLPPIKTPKKSANSLSKGKNGGHTNLLTKIHDNANILIRNLKKGNVLEVSQRLTNDLEKEIIRLSPSLAKLKERLKSLNAKGILISGSGPSVFGLVMTRKEAELMKTILSKRFSQVFVVETL